jgi:hypothetical protein
MSTPCRTPMSLSHFAQIPVSCAWLQVVARHRLFEADGDVAVLEAIPRSGGQCSKIIVLLINMKKKILLILKFKISLKIILIEILLKIISILILLKK